MISVRRATHEVRARDRKRNRLILQIGRHKFHITRKEARSLRDQINKFKLD
jgi:hypothetical protein